MASERMMQYLHLLPLTQVGLVEPWEAGVI
jgi:hypothetical protein